MHVYAWTCQHADDHTCMMGHVGAGKHVAMLPATHSGLARFACLLAAILLADPNRAWAGLPTGPTRSAAPCCPARACAGRLVRMYMPAGARACPASGNGHGQREASRPRGRAMCCCMGQVASQWLQRSPVGWSAMMVACCMSANPPSHTRSAQLSKPRGWSAGVEVALCKAAVWW